MMGNKTAACKFHNDFFKLWKDADPDIPIYRQAKADAQSMAESPGVVAKQ